MANTDRPSGLRPLKHITGAPWNGQMNIYYVDGSSTSAIFKGSLVELDSDSNATGTAAGVKVAGASTVTPLGVAWAFSDTDNALYDSTDLTRNYVAANTAKYVGVIDDPTVVFEIQEDNASSAITAANVGLNTKVTAESGSTTTGLSTMELDTSEVATTSTLPLKILRLVNRPDNALGASAKWEVLLNGHALGGGLGSVGA